MPRSHDPTRVELLRQEERILAEKRVSISVEDIRGALGLSSDTWRPNQLTGPIAPYPLPQFFLQPPSTTTTNGGGTGGNGENGASPGGSMTSLRPPIGFNTNKKVDDDVDLGYCLVRKNTFQINIQFKESLRKCI